MKRITQLTNFLAPTTSNLFGRLKDMVYSGGVPSETGSKILADYMMDLLSVIYFIAGKKGISLNGIADNTEDCQAYDILFGEVSDVCSGISNPAARQLSFSSWRKSEAPTTGPNGDDGEYFSVGAAHSGRHVYLYFRSGNAQVFCVVFNDGTIQGEYVVGLTFVGEPKNDWPLIHNGLTFITSLYTPGAIAPTVKTSVDGVAWASIVLDADTARKGGKTIQKVGSALVLPAYDDADNSYYTSGDSGVTWSRNSLSVTSPLFKPIVSASDGSNMVWVDESGSYVRIYNGTTWADCTINGGTISGSLDKKIVWSGSRFVISDDSDYIYISRDGEPGVFDRYSAPKTGAGAPSVLTGGDGVVVMTYVADMYTATEENAIAGAWVRRENIPYGDGTAGTLPTAAAFDGDAHSMAGSQDSAVASSFISRAVPVQL